MHKAIFLIFLSVSTLFFTATTVIGQAPDPNNNINLVAEVSNTNVNTIPKEVDSTAKTFKILDTDSLILLINLKFDKIAADKLDVFKENWNNNSTFVYTYPSRIESADTVKLVLCDSNRHFILPHFARINSGFGWRRGRAHNGIDIDLDRGTPVKAAFDGKVRYAKYNRGGYGNLVIIRHFNGLETYYSHLDKISVEPDQMVKAGMVIGTGGNTGARWTGEHLHFEIRYLDKPFDPLLIIAYEFLVLKSDTLILTKDSYKITKDHKGRLLRRARTNSSNNIPSGNGKYHYIKSGETLSHIAVRYNTSVNKLCRLNNIRPTTTLQIGRKLRVK